MRLAAVQRAWRLGTLPAATICSANYIAPTRVSRRSRRARPGSSGAFSRISLGFPPAATSSRPSAPPVSSARLRAARTPGPPCRCKDATIYGACANQGLPNSSGQDLFNHSNGEGPGLFAGGHGQFAPHRALIEFNVAAVLPAGAVVTSVQLTMYIGIVAGSGGAPGLSDQTPRMMGLLRLTRDWARASPVPTRPR